MPATTGTVTEAPEFDADAQAWFDAGAVLGATEKTAVNEHVGELKTALLWSKIHYEWICSATSRAASLNDLKGNYNLSHNNSPSWSPDEILGNGSTMSLEASYIAASDGAKLNDYGFFFRIKTAPTGSGVQSVFGSRDAGDAPYNGATQAAGALYLGCNSAFSGLGAGSWPAGSHHIIRLSATKYKRYHNGVFVEEITETSNGLSTLASRFLAITVVGGTGSNYSNAGLTAGGETEGLTAAEVLAHHNALVALDAAIIDGGR